MAQDGNTGKRDGQLDGSLDLCHFPSAAHSEVPFAERVSDSLGDGEVSLALLLTGDRVKCWRERRERAAILANN